MKSLIIYGTMYGTARKYAEALAEELGVMAIPYEDLGPIEHPATIIYVGGMYSGAVLGLRETVRNLDQRKIEHLIVASVGLSSRTNEYDQDQRHKIVHGTVPRNLHDRLTLFHLPGNLDYKKLTPEHERLMTYLINAHRPLVEVSEESRQIVESQGKTIELYDENHLEPLLNHLRSI